MAPKGCAVRGSGARLTPETLALCGSGYSLASSLQPTLTRTHTFSLFLNTPLVPPASRAWLPLLFGASTQDDWVFLCSISDGYKLTACSYALVLVHHSSSQPSSWWATGLLIYPSTHSFIRPANHKVAEWLTRTLTQHSDVIKGKTSAKGCSYAPSPSAGESYSPETRCTCFQRFFNAIGNRIYVRHARLLGADDILNISRAGYADADAARIRIQRVLALCKRRGKLPGDLNRIFTSLLTLSEVETLND